MALGDYTTTRMFCQHLLSIRARILAKHCWHGWTQLMCPNCRTKTKASDEHKNKTSHKTFTMLIPFQYRYVCVSRVITAVEVREIPSEIFNDELTTPTYHHRGIMEEYY